MRGLASRRQIPGRGQGRPEKPACAPRLVARKLPPTPRAARPRMSKSPSSREWQQLKESSKQARRTVLPEARPGADWAGAWRTLPPLIAKSRCAVPLHAGFFPCGSLRHAKALHRQIAHPAVRRRPSRSRELLPHTSRRNQRKTLPCDKPNALAWPARWSAETRLLRHRTIRRILLWRGPVPGFGCARLKSPLTPFARARPPGWTAPPQAPAPAPDNRCPHPMRCNPRAA